MYILFSRCLKTRYFKKISMSQNHYEKCFIDASMSNFWTCFLVQNDDADDQFWIFVIRLPSNQKVWIRQQRTKNCSNIFLLQIWFPHCVNDYLCQIFCYWWFYLKQAFYLICNQFGDWDKASSSTRALRRSASESSSKIYSFDGISNT